jgi:hypothetical protein
MPQLNGFNHRFNQRKNFDAQSRLTCPVCSAGMYRVWRTSHSDFGQSYERETFRCVSCQKEVERYSDGHPHA